MMLGPILVSSYFDSIGKNGMTLRSEYLYRAVTHRLMLLVAAMIVALVPAHSVWAQRQSGALIQQQAEQLERVSVALDAEIRTHMQNVDGWRKLDNVNDRLRRNTSQLSRRVGRDSDHRRLQNDIQKIQALTVELDAQLIEISGKIERRLGKKMPAGAWGHVGTRVSQSVAIADNMRKAVDQQLRPATRQELAKSKPVEPVNKSTAARPTAPAPAPHQRRSPVQTVVRVVPLIQPNQPAPAMKPPVVSTVPSAHLTRQEPLLQAPAPTPYPASNSTTNPSKIDEPVASQGVISSAEVLPSVEDAAGVPAVAVKPNGESAPEVSSSQPAPSDVSPAVMRSVLEQTEQ